MLWDELLFALRANWLLPSVTALVILRLLYSHYTHPLRKYKGPFLASFTELWGVWIGWTGQDPSWLVSLHSNYGKVVRIAPNVLSFGQPEATKHIYMSGFHKGDFYSAGRGVSNGIVVANLFSTTDEAFHSRLRRTINSAFTMTSSIKYAQFVSKILEELLEQLDRRFAGRKGQHGIVDLPEWMSFFAIDVIRELTNSESYGHVESGTDVGGIFAAMQEILTYFNQVGPMPRLDQILWKNPILLWLGRHGWASAPTPTVPFAIKAIKKRQQELQQVDKPDREDLLSKFLNAKRDHPEVVSDKDVLGMSLSTVNAGSDTTAITLTAILYYLVKNPHCLKRLEDEFEACLPARDPNSFKVLTTFSDAQKLPYLDAVVNETFRLHPAFGPILPRVVPPSGATICGHSIKGGTIIGCSAWVLHRDKETFGDDVDVYRLERWLDKEKALAMHRAMFHFGGGAHTCIGKNISLIEIYKLVPSLLRTFKITAVKFNKEWKLTSRVFVGVSDFDVRIERRS